MQKRAEEDLEGRLVVFLGCLQLLYIHAHTASSASFAHEHASDSELFAICFSKVHMHLIFAFVSTGREKAERTHGYWHLSTNTGLSWEESSPKWLVQLPVYSDSSLFQEPWGGHAHDLPVLSLC